MKLNFAVDKRHMSELHLGKISMLSYHMAHAYIIQHNFEYDYFRTAYSG